VGGVLEDGRPLAAQLVEVDAVGVQVLSHCPAIVVGPGGGVLLVFGGHGGGDGVGGVDVENEVSMSGNNLRYDTGSLLF
jgi:hypothetical protein